MSSGLQSLRRWPAILALCGSLALLGAAVVWLSRSDGSETGAADGPGLLVGSRVPGGGWVEQAGSTITRASESEAALGFSSPRTDECAGVRVFETHLADLDAAFTSGASSVIERRDGDRLLATASHTVATFKDAASVDQAISGAKSLFANAQFLDCLRTGAELAGSVPDVERVTAAVAVPGNGAGIAIRYRVGPAGEGGEMVQHILWWRSGRTLSALVVSTWDASVDVPGLVNAAEAALHQRGNR